MILTVKYISDIILLIKRIIIRQKKGDQKALKGNREALKSDKEGLNGDGNALDRRWVFAKNSSNILMLHLKIKITVVIPSNTIRCFEFETASHTVIHH